jgi:outer membrane protein TolC
MASAACARELSLNEALRLAENHSWVLRQAVENADAAGASLEAARDNRWPNLNVTSSAMFKDEIPSFNIELPRPIGTSLEREIGSRENYQIDVQANWPLFTGGKISGGIDLSAALHEAQQFLLEASRRQLWYQTREAYLRVIRADRLLEAAAASRKRTRLVMDDVEAMYEAGVADSVDLLEADLAVIEAEHGVDRAKSGLEIARIELAILLGLPVDEPLELTDRPPSPDKPSNRERNRSRPEIAAAAAMARAKQHSAGVVRAGLWPDLAVFGGYSAGKPNQDFFNNEWNDYFSAGARLTWSFNLAGRVFARSDAAEAEHRAARYEEEQVAEQVSRQAEVAFVGWELAWQSYQAARRRFETTSANYRLAQDKHREGALSSNRLLEIEATLTAAESAHAAAEIDCRLAHTAWLFAVGSDQLKRGFGDE